MQGTRNVVCIVETSSICINAFKIPNQSFSLSLRAYQLTLAAPHTPLDVLALLFYRVCEQLNILRRVIIGERGTETAAAAAAAATNE